MDRAGANRLVGFELVRVLIPMRRPWVSEVGTFSHRDSLLVRAVLACPGPAGPQEVEGWGECVALPGPTYTPEYTAGSLEMSERYLVPALFRTGASRATDVRPALAGVKGNGMAKAAFEAALLDAELRAAGRSMASFFAELSEGGQPARSTVTAGVTIGIAASVAKLLEEVEQCVGMGYGRVKVKIGPGRDLQPVSAIRERWPDLVLFADANGAYQHLPHSEAVELLGQLAPFGLACIEQPLGEEDLLGHAELARRIRVPVCLDEPLTSASAVLVALSLRACSVVSIKAGRMGGFLEAVRAHDLCAQRHVPVWYGGMIETGIARSANLALASLPNFTLPGDLSATGHFFERDLTSPLPLAPGGVIAVPDGPGNGVTVDPDAVNEFSVWRKWCGRDT